MRIGDGHSVFWIEILHNYLEEIAISEFMVLVSRTG